MSITIGSRVPAFPVNAFIPGASEPQQLSLADYGGQWVVLFFYPRDFTFVCPTELHAFAELDSAFADEDAAIVAASTDSYWSHKAWYESNSALRCVRYPVVADTTHKLAQAFGVLTGDGSALRGTFIIDPDGLVRYASVVDQNIGRSPDEVLRVLQALRTGELCPASWRPGQATLVAA